jgi:hypothetical protein
MKSKRMATAAGLFAAVAGELLFIASLAPSAWAQSASNCEALTATYKDFDRAIYELEARDASETKVNQSALNKADITNHRLSQFLTVQLMAQAKCPLNPPAPKLRSGKSLAECGLELRKRDLEMRGSDLKGLGSVDLTKCEMK